MISVVDLQQVRLIIEILRSDKILLPVDSVIGKAFVEDCSCRADRFVYFAVVLDVALHACLGIGFCMLPLFTQLSPC